MEWVTNATARVTLDNVSLSMKMSDDGTVIMETRTEALAREREFRAGLVTGPPKATEQFTISELYAQGIIGLYAPERAAGAGSSDGKEQ